MIKTFTKQQLWSTSLSFLFPTPAISDHGQDRDSQTYFAPDSLQSDPIKQNIVACGRSLAAMCAAKQFVDDGSCQ